MDQVNLLSWTGRTVEETGGIDARQASLIHATLGQVRAPCPQFGDPLPQLWHWAGFPPTASLSELGTDGHPRPGQFLPPLPQARRMWAGGSLRFHAPIHVGDVLTRRSSVRDIVRKDRADGEMVFVTLDHHIYGPRGLAVQEQQDIVYLPMPDRFLPPKPKPLPDQPVLREQVDASEALLFRYSALTFNAHRIHYDLAYAQDVEHYPGLVVHGPLQATLLMQAAVRYAGRPVSDFHYRGVHPVFAGSLEVLACEDDGALSLCTAQEGHQGMQATALWEATQ